MQAAEANRNKRMRALDQFQIDIDAKQDKINTMTQIIEQTISQIKQIKEDQMTELQLQISDQ